MSEASQNDPMTRYLLYKVAVRSRHHDLAAECLEIISASANCRDFLYACVSESQKFGDKACAVQALWKLAEKYEYEAPNAIHLPALLRCTIRLLYGMIEEGNEKGSTASMIQNLCDVFNGGIIPPTPSSSGRLSHFPL